MNLLNTLLDQPVILVTLGLAWLIFVIAITIQFVQLIRARLRLRQRRQAVEAARQTVLRRARAKALAEMRAQADGNNGASDEAAGQDSVATLEQVNALTDAPTEPEVSTEMQSLLSDVFVDETAAARYAILIDGLEEVDAQDLSRALHAVAEQLRHDRDIA